MNTRLKGYLTVHSVILSVFSVCHRSQAVARQAVENAELGRVVSLWVGEDHSDKVLMLRLLHLHIDFNFLVQLIVPLENRNHRVVQQITFKLSLAACIFLQKLFVVTLSINSVLWLVRHNCSVSYGGLCELRLDSSLFNVCLNSNFVVLLQLARLLVL